MDIIICVIETLLNDNWCFLLMGVVGLWLYLEVNLYCLYSVGVMAAGCWSELRGGCFWEVYNVQVPR